MKGAKNHRIREVRPTLAASPASRIFVVRVKGGDFNDANILQQGIRRQKEGYSQKRPIGLLIIPLVPELAAGFESKSVTV